MNTPCKKCGGKRFFDVEEKCIYCINCGHREDLEPIPDFILESVKSGKPGPKTKTFSDNEDDERDTKDNKSIMDPGVLNNMVDKIEQYANPGYQMQGALPSALQRLGRIDVGWVSMPGWKT